MKHFLTLALAGLISFNSGAQSASCCHTPQDMLALAADAKFVQAHDAPEPFQYQKPRGSMITFQTLDGKTGKAYYVPSSEASTRTLIVFHEWWGLNDYIRREADRLQDSLGAVDVYALDLYDGKVATSQEQASAYAAGLDKRRTDILIKGMLTKAGRDNTIATLGWCLGGGYAFRASVLAEKQAAGTVMYYGFPEKDAKNIAPLQADVLYIRGTQDSFITQAMLDPFVAEVKHAGRNITVESYDAAHAFANPSNPKHDAAASADALGKAVRFLRSQLAL